jgi:ABC-type xylose transport system substrate-binding protein
VGVHTCSPTEYARQLEAENTKLKKDMADTAQLLEKLTAANSDLGAIVTSTSGVLGSITKALKEKGYG